MKLLNVAMLDNTVELKCSLLKPMFSKLRKRKLGIHQESCLFFLPTESSQFCDRPWLPDIASVHFIAMHMRVVQKKKIMLCCNTIPGIISSVKSEQCVKIEKYRTGMETTIEFPSWNNSAHTFCR